MKRVKSGPPMKLSPFMSAAAQKGCMLLVAALKQAMKTEKSGPPQNPSLVKSQSQRLPIPSPSVSS